MDETGITTLLTPAKVIAPKGKKQVGSMTSGEQGTNITRIFFVNAMENSVPFMMLFPRVNLSHIPPGAPPGTVGTAHISGCHKLPPLDRGVFGPFKKYYSTACSNWRLTNPRKPITLHEVAENVGKSYPLAFTPVNILAGFCVSGMWPVNPNLLTDDEYLSSSVTDRPDPSINCQIILLIMDCVLLNKCCLMRSILI
ncbi:uncharacterized protein TNCV_1510071 [Trichonephila clavipes]|nr:uncharacterized protein TNCV_1510071 [Trichonephila clavipes]